MADTKNIDGAVNDFEKNRERKDLPALSEALMHNKLDIAQALIDRKADVNEYAKKPAPERGLAPIHFAESAQAVKMLAAAGANIDAPYKSDHAWGMKGETKLQTLALTGQVRDMPTINALLVAGADAKRPFGQEYMYGPDSTVPAKDRIERQEMSMAARLDIIRENHTPKIPVQLLTKNRDDQHFVVVSESVDFQAVMKNAEKLQKMGVDIIVNEKDNPAVVHAKSNLDNNVAIGRVIQPEMTPDGTYLKGRGEIMAANFYDKLNVDYKTFADRQQAAQLEAKQEPVRQDLSASKEAASIAATHETKAADKGDMDALDADKGTAAVGESGLSVDEIARRAAQQESIRAAENLKQEQREPDAPDEKNVVEEYKERELDVIDGKEAVERANLLRQRERDQLALKQQSLGLDAEGKRIDVQNLSDKAVRQDNANDLADRTGGTTDRQAQLLTEREKNRQIELMEQVHNQFRVAGSKYYFKDQPGKLAMKDNGERMVTASNDDRVAKAMATMAEAKGWKTIKVSGHPDFQREVWMEANLRGIEARGYKPTEQDLKLLDAKRERAMHNSVEHDDRAPRARGSRPDVERKTDSAREQPTEKPAARDASERAANTVADKAGKTDSARQERPVASEKEAAKGNAGIAAEKAARPALRTHEGQVLEHGKAPYNFDKLENDSYFVKLANSKGKDEVVWGKDLERAMKGIKPGANVKLEYRGSEAVEVSALKRDGDGKVVGRETIGAKRNEWEVLKTDKAKVSEAVGAALIDAKVKNPAQREALKSALGERLAEREKVNKVPAVAVYDKAAPGKTQTPERTGPVVERNAERTR